MEKTNIENSISITAYHKEKISSANDLILQEYLRVAGDTALEVDSTNQNARIIYQTRNGLEYMGKEYFVFKNGIGYIIFIYSNIFVYGFN